MKRINYPLSILGASLLALMVACDQQGPMEEAGENVDEAVEETGESMEEAGENIKEGAEDASDKFGETLDNTVND